MIFAALNFHSCLFVLFALVACGFAIAVAVTSNVVRMAFYLTLSLGATSGLFFLAGSEFVGAMQLMIYVGGTLVLLIFGVMLTAQSRFISMKTSPGEWILGLIVGSALLLLLVRAAFEVEDWRIPPADQSHLVAADAHNSTALGLALSGIRPDQLSETNPVLRDGMSGYLLPFVIVSMHLLVVLIGAGYMARTKKAATGAILERAPAVPRTGRTRPWYLSALLALGMLINLGAAIKMFLIVRVLRPMIAENKLGELIGKIWHMIPPLDTAPEWAFIALGLLFLANVLLLAVVWGWQKWGVIGLVLVPLIQAMVMNNAGFRPLDIVGNTMIGLLPVALIIVLLCVGRRPTIWSQME